MNNCLANLGIGFGGGAGQNIRLNMGEKQAVLGLAVEIKGCLFASHIVCEDALDRTHSPTGIGGSLGHFFRVDAAVEHGHLVV